MKSIPRYILLSGIMVLWAYMEMFIFYDNFRLFSDYFYGLIHLPARYLGDLWIYLRVPPHGDAAIVVIPPVAVGLQWFIILVMVFFLTRKKRHKKVGENTSHDGD